MAQARLKCRKSTQIAETNEVIIGRAIFIE